MKVRFAFFLGAVILVALLGFIPACAAKLPEVIQHEPPDIQAPDFSPFIEAGCLDDYIGYLTCPADSPPAKLDCSYLQTVEPLLGALSPSYPFVKCQLGYDRNPSEEGNFIYEEGCLDHRWVQYVIYIEGHYQSLMRTSDLQRIYMPIDTPEEALSYAVAATGLDPRYDIETPPEYKYEVDQIEETWVEETANGYRVHLFEYQPCGCGPHYLKSVAVNVLHDGQIIKETPLNLFRDPQLDNVCGD